MAGIFAAALLALLGFPPFSLFASELAIARAGFSAHLGWAVGVAFTLALLAFAAMARHTASMVLGGNGNEAASPVPAAEELAARWPLVTGLVAAAALGVTAWPVTTLISVVAPAGR